MDAPDPKLLRAITEGHAAESLLLFFAQFATELVEYSLQSIDQRVERKTLTPETAQAICYEIAAYRRMHQRLVNTKTRGEKASAALAPSIPSENGHDATP